MKTYQKGIIIPDFMIMLKWLEENGKCTMDLHHELGISYKHLHQFKKYFVEQELAVVHKQGLRHNLFLTDKGQQVLAVVNAWFDVLGFSDADIKEFIKLSKRGKRKKDTGVGVQDFKLINKKPDYNTGEHNENIQ